jgi:hypothetical protein
MQEATLLRWREGVVEGTAWLAQRGVEELALWMVGGIIARGLGEIIDRHFEPWYHRAADPPGVLKTAEQAREAALRELRSQFPGLK